MSTQNDGGPAFPASHQAREGMTLRDWFAGMALAACGDHIKHKNTAAEAFEIADAMLAVRERKEEA